MKSCDAGVEGGGLDPVGQAGLVPDATPSQRHYCVQQPGASVSSQRLGRRACPSRELPGSLGVSLCSKVDLRNPVVCAMDPRPLLQKLKPTLPFQFVLFPTPHSRTLVRSASPLPGKRQGPASVPLSCREGAPCRPRPAPPCPGRPPLPRLGFTAALLGRAPHFSRVYVLGVG